MFLAIRLENRVESMAADVRRIADAVAPVTSPAVPRYVLQTEEGETLGVHDFGTSVWEPGDRIPMPPDPTVVVVEVPDVVVDELPVLIVRRDD